MRISGCEYPDSLLFDREGSVWAKKEGAAYRVGVAPVLAWLSGGIRSVTFKPGGSRIAGGAGLGSVEGPRHFDVVRAPFDCVLVETNRELLREPGLVAKDPYGRGWFALLEAAGPTGELKPAGELAQAIEARLRALKVRCFAEFPDTELYVIGVECSAVLVQLNDLLAESAGGTTVHVVSDDPTAQIEMERWQDQTGNALLESFNEGAVYHFIVKKM